MGDDDSSPSRKVAKKKHYPFGTPSHLRHPFSEFSHLQNNTRDFALDLATATDVHAEVIVEEPKKRRPLPSPQKLKAKKAAESDDLDQESLGSQTEASDMQPCTKLPCQLVIRAIGDLEYKNEVERLDLEDEYEKWVNELKFAEQDVKQSEVKVDKLNDIGNQLEIKLTQIMTKVEQLEKSKENLNNERSDINSKVLAIISFSIH